MNIKKMNAREFREKGYLQEANRRFFHPLGLALEMTINIDGTESISGIWDYREDSEGMYYDLKNSPQERKDAFEYKYKFIEEEFKKRIENRKKKLGFFIEPIK